MTAFVGKRVLIAGLGGLGCPTSLALARAGVAALTLMDPERVELSNLHRQLWHEDGDVGALKVVSAATKLGRAFPSVSVKALPSALDERNADALFGEHDLVVDGTDSVGAKFLLSDTSVRTGVPVVYGGVVGMAGRAMVIRRGGPCLRCLFEVEPDPKDSASCASAGVLGSLAGVVGGLQVALAGSELGQPSPPSMCATLVVVDGLSLTSRAVRVLRSPECGSHATSDGRQVT
jgi:adenylyltransferase/sulfurtransferase